MKGLRSNHEESAYLVDEKHAFGTALGNVLVLQLLRISLHANTL
jgi:hypothetical protein